MKNNSGSESFGPAIQIIAAFGVLAASFYPYFNFSRLREDKQEYADYQNSGPGLRTAHPIKHIKEGSAEDSDLEKRTQGISGEGIEMIKGFEGFREEAYLCPASVWTLGYGHTKNVRKGDRVTKEQAEQMLLEDLSVYEQAVRNHVLVNLTQNQYDALVSFVYNVGPEAFEASTLLRVLNSGDYDGAGREFERWNKSKGKVLEGLKKRRAREKELFLRRE